MITKLTIRNLKANAGRFAMTTFGVVLAVSFVVSAFVLGDGLRNTFGELSTEIVAGTDLEVRPVDEFGSTETLDDDDRAAVLAVDGVDVAVGQVEAPENSVRPITSDGDEIPTAGPPQLAFAWVDAVGLSPFELVEGDAPGPGEFVIDIGSSDRHGFEVGESYTVVTATGRHELALSGLQRFGSDNQTLGAVLMSMNATETDALFGTTGYDSIAVSLSEAARADIAGTKRAIESALVGFEVVDQTTLADETAADFNSEIDVVQNILLGFAGISLLVSIFIIGNTFAIVLAQRTREMGLLRLVGADAGQLRTSAMGEAAAIGVIASAIGIPGGIGVAVGLTAALGAVGVDLPGYDIIVSPSTIAVAVAVGLGVTLLAAWWPARSASSVPAMAALRGGQVEGEASLRGRSIAAGAVGLLGVGLATIGVVGAGSAAASITLIVVGSLALLGAVTLISPRLVGPLSAAFAALFDRLGMPGRLAVRNARRNAGRTATTAAALMIGLAVVSMALVIGESVKTQFGATLDTVVTADYVVTDQASEAGFPTQAVEVLAADPAIGEATGFRIAEMQIGAGPDTEIVEVAAAGFDAVPEVLDLAVSDGGYSDAAGAVLVNSERAAADSIAVGDTVDATLSSGAPVQLTVTGLFDDDSVIEQDWLVDTSVFDQGRVVASETWIAFNVAEGVDAEASEAAVARFEALFPQGEVETAGEFRERVEGLIDQILSVLNALVALAVIIALIGIANTLALSVNERTREIGLVRAVGMTRQGVRRMIRYESAVIATFGAVLGVVLGVGFGWLTVAALPASFADAVAVPVGQIAVLVVIAGGAGVLAALLPARRAGRMNVLAAIAT